MIVSAKPEIPRKTLRANSADLKAFHDDNDYFFFFFLSLPYFDPVEQVLLSTWHRHGSLGFHYFKTVVVPEVYIDTSKRFALDQLHSFRNQQIVESFYTS